MTNGTRACVWALKCAVRLLLQQGFAEMCRYHHPEYGQFYCMPPLRSVPLPCMWVLLYVPVSLTGAGAAVVLRLVVMVWGWAQ